MARLLSALVVVVLLALLYGASADALGVRASPRTVAGHQMPPSGQEDQQAVGERKPMTLSDLERMRAESDEIWRNRPRMVPTEDVGGLKIAEQRVCKLPNGGVSSGVREQLQRIHVQREAEKRKKEERERKAEEQQREQNKEL